MPSLHVGMAPVVAWALIKLTPWVWTKVLGVAYPFLVAVSIVVTGNHFILDIVGGLAVVLPAAAISAWLVREPRPGRSRPRRRCGPASRRPPERLRAGPRRPGPRAEAPDRGRQSGGSARRDSIGVAADGAGATRGSSGTHPADVLGIFGITGDLATRMTLPSSTAWSGGLLDGPVVGWGTTGRSSGCAIAGRPSRPRARPWTRRSSAGSPGACRTSRATSPTRRRTGAWRRPSAAPRARLLPRGAALAVRHRRRRPRRGRPHRERTGRRGEALRPRPRLGPALAADLQTHLDESQIFRIDHFLGKMGLEEILYLRLANAMLEPLESQLRRLRPDHHGRDGRRRGPGYFYDPVGALRDVVVNHLMQVVASIAMEPPAANDAVALKTAAITVLRAVDEADPARYVRGQYDGYRAIEGVAADSPPRPTRRCASRSTTGAGGASRSSSAPASACRRRSPRRA